MSTSISDAYVSFQEVQKSYDGENLVVKDLNLGVERGEFMTMLGPSGSIFGSILRNNIFKIRAGQ